MNTPRCVAAMLVLAIASWAQQKASSALPAMVPEMQKLESAFVGDWKTTETMERSQFFPNGGGRSGIAHFRMGPGGYSLIGEGHSDGSAGKLEFMIVTWWDPSERLYQYFVCFNGATRPCRIRGTAHWEGNTFVNEYESSEGGKNAKWKDTFTDITANSFVLVAAMQLEDGSMKTMITTKNDRRR